MNVVDFPPPLPETQAREEAWHRMAEMLRVALGVDAARARELVPIWMANSAQMWGWPPGSEAVTDPLAFQARLSHSGLGVTPALRRFKAMLQE